MGLQTGTKLAQTASPLIDPADLKIVAYEVEGSQLVDHPTLIRVADVRELSDVGMIIDSSDEFIALEDVVKIQQLYQLDFKLVGMNVVDESKHKLGRIEDYSLDSSSFIIQQLSVRRGIIKSLTDTSLLVHRSQIVEINDNFIVVRSTAERQDQVRETGRQTFINPFRPAPNQPELSRIDHN